MTAHEKRLLTFEYQFKYDPKYGKNVLSAGMIDSKIMDRVVKKYAPDIDNERNSVLGLYDVKRKPKGKKGILFTDYKFYCNLKKARKQKVWYDEIVSVKTKLFNRKKLVIRTEDGDKIVIKTTKRLSNKIINFINEINEYNEEITKPNYSLESIKNAKSPSGDLAAFEIAKREMINRGFEEEKFHAQQGHGFAAERANNMIDKFQGKKVEIVGDNNVKNGADRIEYFKDGSFQLIQTKYCKTAAESVDACFNDDGFRYYDGHGKPMAIEVPSDQYEASIKRMSEKIKSGKVKGITDPKEAENIIKKGNITYRQAVNIAKAGTVESITYDAINGMVVSASAFGISAIVSLATSIWNGEGFDVAIKRATYTSLKVGGASFVTSVLASQLSKAGLNSMLVPGTEAIAKAMGSKASAVIVNAFRGTAKNIYGAAAIKSAAKLLRTNIITSIIMLVVFSIGDFINLLRRRITFRQFSKNFIVLALSIAASIGGGIGGAALGSMIFPGVGTTILSILFAILAGSLVGFFGKKLLGLFLKEDADLMVEIINEEFGKIIEEYLLSKNEAEKVIDKFTKKISMKELRKMVASKDKGQYARDLLIPITEKQVRKIVEPPKEIMIASFVQVLEAET